MDVETCVAPAQDLLDKGKADELFPEKQGEDLMGEDFLDNLVMETTDTVEGAPHSSRRLAWQEGQHPRVLQENISRRSSSQSGHRMRANPYIGIATIEILLNNILDHGTEIAVLLLEPIIIFSKEHLKIIKQHPVKHRVFRMTLAVDPCHGRGDDS